MKGTVGGITTTYIGNYFEWTGSTATMVKYYYAGNQRIAMMAGSTVYYLLTDRLGSTALTVTSAGAIYGEKRYKPWGEERYTSGTTPTTLRFTGQRFESFGLYWVGSRWYDPSLARWVQPDVVVPEAAQGIQAWDRYAYGNNNPVYYTDPSGHFAFLATAAAGLVIGLMANYTVQTIGNLNQGMSFGDAISWSNIDKKDLAVAAVGGLVGGLTMGAATAATGAIGLTGGVASAATGVLGGAASNVVAGQAEALTSAAIDQVTNNTTFDVTSDGRHTITFNPNASQFLANARSNGFRNSNTIIRDATAGAVIGGFSAAFQGIIADAGTPGAEFLGSQPASWIRPASRTVDYFAATWLRNDSENRTYSGR